MENSDLDTGLLETTIGNKGNVIGAEVISSEVDGDGQLIEIRVPIDPRLVDEVYVMTPEGNSVHMTRGERILQNYEDNNVGIWIRLPSREKTGFRLKLIDYPDDTWPADRQQ